MLALDAMIYFIKIYIDDLNQGYVMLPYGTYYKDGKMYRSGMGWSGRSKPGATLSPDEKKEIMERSERKAAQPHSRERESAATFREIANEVLPDSVRMVEDIPGNYVSGYLPILDTQMSVVNGNSSTNITLNQ